MPNAEIKGIGFPNKGAELLLNASMEQLINEGFDICTEPYSPYQFKVNYPLYTKTRIGFKGINILWPLNVMPKYIKERLGFVSCKEVDLILDASGYAYGDPWSLSLANNRLLQDNAKCKKVILPQSLGPFTNADSRKVASQIAKKCDLIFAREETGAKHFYDATGVQVDVIPDITFCLEVEKHDTKSDVLIIPNFQVSKRDGQGYIELLKEVAENLIIVGRKVSIMNHEGMKDKEISFEVIEYLKRKNLDVDYIEPKDGLEAKSLIKNANFVITSRYHGLISSLSSSVPCLAIGWSFKYDEAMALFELNAPTKFNSADEVVSLVLNEDYNNKFKSEKFASDLLLVKSKVTKMWQSIFNKQNS